MPLPLQMEHISGLIKLSKVRAALGGTASAGGAPLQHSCLCCVWGCPAVHCPAVLCSALHTVSAGSASPQLCFASRRTWKGNSPR